MKRNRKQAGRQAGGKHTDTMQQAFECELALLADDYHCEPANLSYRMMAEVLGRVFAAQCLSEHGLRGYQYAEQGIQAILSALRDMPPRSTRSAEAVEANRV